MPEVKRVTDEELAEKYGIHLATRLHTDPADKQANWADIEDDDDDWAPETMEWADGTKVTVPTHTDSPVPEPAKPVPQASAPALPPPAVAAATKTEKPASPGPSMTSSMKLGGGRGLVLKAGASEKPTLVAKPPALSVVKSPWAPLPPVDKASPVITELPQHHQQRPSFINRNPHGSEGMSRPPATEIAADDFSRGWRENDSGASRELYNSQSGRYEPVNDARRGSRNDMHSHAPALLQRRHEMQGPAEPSSAFQTHRDHVADASYGRRRTSSNVSGGSGMFARRMSRESYPPHNMPDARRPSFIAPGPEPAMRMQSPAGQTGRRPYPQQQQQSWQSPASAHAQLALAHGHQPVQTPPAVIEDEVELQKKIMRESRDLARKRRLEQEAKEEAERKERIRLKLEAMGPPPESKKKKEEEKPAPTQIQSRESTESTTSAQPQASAAQAGEVRQFGMMKVHPPETAKPQFGTGQGLQRQEQPQDKEDARPNGPSSSATVHGGRENSQEPEQSLHNSQPSSPGRYPSWNQNQGRNLWGPPTNDRTLGNGTFNQELSMGVQGPGPIGPPLNNRGNGQYAPRHRDQYAPRPAPIGPPSRQQEQRPTTGSVTPGFAGDVSARIAEDDARRRAEAERDVGSRGPAAPTVFKDTWRPIQLGPDGRRIVGDAMQKEVGGPISGAPSQQQQTWIDFPQRPPQQETPPFAGIEHGVHSQQSWAQGNMGDSPSNIMPTPSRGSRFFPQRDAPREMPPPDRDYARRSGSPSPPPPDMMGHPAYDGDVAHPHVSLPKARPTVKLPPLQQAASKVLAPIAPPKPISFAAAAAAAASIPSGPRVPVAVPNIGAKGQTPGGGWQDKINNLMGRKPSPPKTHAMTVDSSSKHALNQSINHVPTISFPGFSSQTTDNGDYETKPMAEECFEEQEMGFVPVVKVPRDVPKNAYDLFPAPKGLHWKVIAMLEIESAREPEMRPKIVQDGELIKIHFPSMGESDSITVVHKVDQRQRSSTNRRPGRAGRGSSSTYTRGGRGRGGDGPNSYPASPNEGGSPATGTPSSSRGGRGRGPYGSSWNQRSPAPSAVNANA